MKYVFIINPKAGGQDCYPTMVKTIKAVSLRRQLCYEIYITTCIGDATRFTAQYDTLKDNNLCCFIACGGDGTLGEVVTGAVGKANCAVGVLPFGTGNDFIKSFRGKESFINLFNLLDATLQPIDLLLCGDRYAINLCNIGFDAKVAYNMAKFKRVPLLNGNMAYNASVLYSLKDKLYCDMRIIFDDGEQLEMPFLLLSAANGNSYGGGFYAAPNASINDGLIDFCAIKKIPLYKIAQLIGIYKNGEHIGNPKVAKYIYYRRCSQLEVSSHDPFTVCIDGELSTHTNITISVKPKSLTFLVPHGSTIKPVVLREPELSSI
ncbi:MAG: diacylglycerol kinase family lipid kinase [Oscillospiraceae bacterium]